MTATLIAADGKRFALDAPCLVGRGPYNHVVLDDTRISRQHAKISPEAGGHVVHDLNSANGTFVNDVQVKKRRLAPNDVVRFGPFAFTFEEGPPADRGAPQGTKPKFIEVLTSVGVEPAANIVDSLDATQGLRELEDADRRLRTLYGFMRSIATTLDTGALLECIQRNLFDVYPEAQSVAIYLRDPNGQMEPRTVVRRNQAEPSRLMTFPATFHEEVVVKGRAILSAPATGQKGRARRGVSMHAPMIFDGEALGVINVRAEEGTVPFRQGDLDLLSGLAAQAATALKNARFYEESLKQQRLQQDLQLAQQIQMSFLPRQLPVVEGIAFQTEYRPAFTVGGDFYDVFWLNYDRIGVFIGDVSGKGVSAALLMARISSDLRLAAAAESDPGRALGHVNRIVLERRQTDIFVTGVYYTLDVKKHVVTLANAGHVAPLVRRAKKDAVDRIEGGEGAAIGIFDDAEYQSLTLQLDAGDAIVVCTDGVIEATNLGGEQFGTERLAASVGRGESRAEEVAERLMRDLHGHVGEAAQYDDITLCVCGIRGREAAPRRPG